MHVRKIDTSETAAIFGVEAVAYPCRCDFPFRMLSAPRHRSSLSCGRYLLASLTGNKEGSKGIMVLRVKPTPTRAQEISQQQPATSFPSLISRFALQGLLGKA